MVENFSQKIFLIFLFSNFSCVLGEFYKTVTPVINNVERFYGKYCSSEPQEIMDSTKILFLVDCTGSMVSYDKEGLRVEAIKKVVEQYRPHENILFAMMRFGETVEDLTPDGFTKDENILNPGFEKAAKYDLGETVYLDVLEKALVFLQNDINVNIGTKLTKYIIVFISDGVPTRGSEKDTRDKILSTVRTMVGLQQGIFFQTIFLGTETVTVEEFVNILPEMAEMGKGQFKQVQTAESMVKALTELLKVPKTLLVYQMKKQAFFVSNHNTAVWNNEQLGKIDVFVDSDGDGLPDFFEDSIQTSPLLKDSDGDGVSDMVEYRLTQDPKTYNTSSFQDTDAIPDTDNDGLNDLEESLLKSKKDYFDTDNDGIPDPLEVRFGTDWIVEDADGDYDEDKVPNLDEIKAHTNPRINENIIPNNSNLRNQLKYESSQVQEVTRDDGHYCYEFEVKNLRLLTTLPTALNNNEEGWNNIFLYGVDEATKDPSQKEMFRMSLKKMRYIDKKPMARYPDLDNIRLNEVDFVDMKPFMPNPLDKINTIPADAPTTTTNATVNTNSSLPTTNTTTH